MAGKRQHYIPRFLQRGFLADHTDNAERTWLHRRGTSPRLVVTKDVGVGEYFYSKLAIAGEETLDDLITSFECDIQADLRAIQKTPPGNVIEPITAARITTHLTLRTAHLRSVLQQGMAEFLDQISTMAADSDQLRELIGVDNIEMNRVLAAIDEELSSSPLGDLLPRPFAKRFVAFWLRESFNDVYAAHMAMFEEGLHKLIKTLPSTMRDGHNKALRTTNPTQWEADLAQLSWRTHTVVDAILPDCIALAQVGADPLTPLLLKEQQIPDSIILPIAHNLLLVGSRGEPMPLDIDTVNAASAACSDSFFIARSSYHSTDLSSLIGQRCSLAIKRVVDEAMAEVHPRRKLRSTDMIGITQLASDRAVENFSFSLTCQDFFDVEAVEKLGEIMQVVVREINRELPLSELDGMTFSADYAAALEGLDRGDPTLSSEKTNPRAYGQAVAKCVHVIRNGESKEHLIFDACIAVNLFDAADENRSWALHLIVSMLADVAHSRLFNQRLPAIQDPPLDSITSRLHTASSTSPGRYFSARTSAFADTKAGERFATLFSDSLLSAQQEIRVARQVYLADHDMDRLLDVALLHISFVLAHAAEWLGHRDGVPAQEPFPGASLLEQVRTQGLSDWFELFGRDLQRLYDAEEQFNTENIFALSRHVERLLWTMGMFPWPTEDGNLYVSLAPLSGPTT